MWTKLFLWAWITAELLKTVLVLLSIIEAIAGKYDAATYDMLFAIFIEVSDRRFK